MGCASWPKAADLWCAFGGPLGGCFSHLIGKAAWRAGPKHESGFHRPPGRPRSTLAAAAAIRAPTEALASEAVADAPLEKPTPSPPPSCEFLATAEEEDLNLHWGDLTPPRSFARPFGTSGSSDKVDQSLPLAGDLRSKLGALRAKAYVEPPPARELSRAQLGEHDTCYGVSKHSRSAASISAAFAEPGAFEVRCGAVRASISAASTEPGALEVLALLQMHEDEAGAGEALQQRRLPEPSLQDSLVEQYGSAFSCMPCSCSLHAPPAPQTTVQMVGLSYDPPGLLSGVADATWRGRL